MPVEHLALQLAKDAWNLANDNTRRGPVASAGLAPKMHNTIFVGEAVNMALKGPAAYGADPTWQSIVWIYNPNVNPATNLVTYGLWRWGPNDTGVSDGFNIIDAPGAGYTGSTPGRWTLLQQL